MMKAIVAGARGFAAAMPVLLRDLVGLAGATLVSYGAWMIFAPAGFITGGALLIVGAALAARTQRAGS